jgi:hypothetical protein
MLVGSRGLLTALVSTLCGPSKYFDAFRTRFACFDISLVLEKAEEMSMLT